jgi:hypothetical protein
MWLLGCESPKDFDAVHVQIMRKDCVTCHEPDYERAQKPLHQQLQKQLYPRQCGSCHDNEHWAPAHFQHPFSLDGQHALTACQQCHVGSPPVFAGTAKQCVGCHLSNFQGSPFPGHADFPDTCRDCHTTSAWKPATGPHPEAKFPIATGVHKYPCLDCHNSKLGPNSAANTDCVGCHDGVHQREVLDPIHQALKLADYPTTPNQPANFCLNCHPSGAR